MTDYETDVMEVSEEMPVKNRHKALRRHNSISKALRKKNISSKAYGFDWYNNLHQYSKNKIHCSCGMCRFRSAWEPNRRPVADMKRLDSMKYDIKEYMKSA